MSDGLQHTPKIKVNLQAGNLGNCKGRQKSS